MVIGHPLRPEGSRLFRPHHYFRSFPGPWALARGIPGLWHSPPINYMAGGAYYWVPCFSASRRAFRSFSRAASRSRRASRMTFFVDSNWAAWSGVGGAVGAVVSGRSAGEAGCDFEVNSSGEGGGEAASWLGCSGSDVKRPGSFPGRIPRDSGGAGGEGADPGFPHPMMVRSAMEMVKQEGIRA